MGAEAKMLKLIDCDTTPTNINFHGNIKLQPGKLVYLSFENGKINLNPADGFNIFGIVDDIHSDVLRSTCWDEKVLFKIRDYVQTGSDRIILTKSIFQELSHPNIIRNSFSCSSEKIKLNDKNGVISLENGTVVSNFEIMVNCRYAYNIFLNNFDSSTSSTNAATIWYRPCKIKTDMFDTTAEYEVNSPLFATNGLFTTRKNDDLMIPCGYVICPPTNTEPFLEVEFRGRNYIH